MRADNRHRRYAPWGLALVMLLITATGAWAQTETPQPPPATTPSATTLPVLTLPSLTLPTVAPLPSFTPPVTKAPAKTQGRASMEIYGFAMLDIGQNFKTINPNWFDTMRVTKLPSFAGQHGEDNSTFAGVRQSRLGVSAGIPTALGELKTKFEFEMFGVGVDEGQTTFRLRHAWGELGQFGAGQTWSVFMDPDVFPNSLEYWGPTGMVFFRNVQVRWTPVLGDMLGDNQSLMFALERPGASGDPGTLANRIELQNIRGRSPMPDITGAYTMKGNWGYVKVAGIIRRIAWDDVFDDQFELSGAATGWGLNFSSNLKPGKDNTIRIQVVYGEGIQNYMNDSPVDVGIVFDFANAQTPIRGELIPILGTVFFWDRNWGTKWTTSVGFSHQENDNTEGQAPDAFRNGYYALGNLLYIPAPGVMLGGEFQWGRRENFGVVDGFQKYDGYKLQFSFKYNFSFKLGG